jgi:NitT/TauT family transport system ATP-binding protein
MEHAVELHDVTQVYVTDRGATLAVEKIAFQVEPGEFVSLIGPSGCGKTTILSIIAGLLAPTRGRVFVGGRPVAGPSPQVGYMLQQDYLFPWRTIYGNIVLGLELMNRRDPASRDYALHLLKEMGLGDRGSQYPHQLSGGMRQRAALVRTLATKPDILLLDEPFSALDYQTKLQLEDLVVQTLRTHKKTAILVTHDISEAIAMSDRVIVLEPDPGKIRREFAMPEPLKRALPLEAREKEGFHDIFREIWEEFVRLDPGKGDGR